MRQNNDFISMQVDETTRRLGARIMLVRKARKLSKVKLEKMVRIHRTTLTRMEDGDPNVALGKFLMVLEALQHLSDIELVLSTPETVSLSRKSVKPVLDDNF